MNDNPTGIKIQSFIAHNSQYSRRKAEELVTAGEVLVNQKKAKVGQRVTERDLVKIGSVEIKVRNQNITFLINKPRGYVSTTSDELGRKTVLDLVPKQKIRLYPIGRLDADSQGLMLLTSDGELTYKMTHPKFNIFKVYQITLDRKISFLALEHLRKGVKLKDGWAKPDSVEIAPKQENQNKTTLIITLHEGRNREVRRMLNRVGYEVESLTRVKFGKYSIEDLQGKDFILL